MDCDVLLKASSNEYANFFTIFDGKIASKCLRGIAMVDSLQTANIRPAATTVAAVAAANDFLDGLVVADKMSCSTCGVHRFYSRREQVTHYKTGWHCHNLKRKLDNMPAVDENAYNLKIKRPSGSSSSSASFSSDTGSSSEEMANTSHDDEIHVEGLQTVPQTSNKPEITERKSARLYFANEQGYLFSMHRCVITNKQEETSHEELAKRIGDLVSGNSQPKWAVILLGGGRFAAAVFDGCEVVIHKTLHRYVVRAKQGSSQATHDRSRHALSAGAALRRHNEQALETEVQSLLMGPWHSHLSDCSLVFHRSAGGQNRRILFGSGSRKLSPFDRNDSRLRTIPFATRRACFREVVAAHRKLATVECHGPEVDWRNAQQSQPQENSPSPRKWLPKQNKPKSTKSDEKRGKNCQGVPVTERESNSDDDEDELVWEAADVVCDFSELKTSDCTKPLRSKQRKDKTCKTEDASYENTATRDRLYTACKLARLEVIREAVASVVDPCGSAAHFLNRTFGKLNTTHLHVVVQSGCRGAVTILLESGADPTLRDSMGRPPYVLAADVHIRKEFRRFRARFPDRYDYKVAQIPAALTEEDEKAKAERQKLLRSQRRHRAKEQATESKAKTAFLNLTDTEKIRAAGDANGSPALLQLPPPRCFTCAKSLQGLVPFEYNRFKFCQISCLKDHRLKNRQ